MGSAFKLVGVALVGLLFVADYVAAQSLAYAPWIPLQSAPRRDYDIRFGELFFDLEGSLELQYNSNITTSERNEIADFIITPGISAGGSWNYSDLNTLRFGIGLQYRYFLRNPQLGSNGSIFDLTPETELDSIILVGDVYIRLFDRITLSTDATDTVGIDVATGDLIFNTTSYAVFENTLGAQINYDFNILQSSAQIYRKDVFSLEDNFDFLDRVEHGISGTLSRRFLATMTVGVGASINTTDYKTDFKGGVDSASLGVYSNTVLTPFVTLYAGVNWATSTIESTALSSERNSEFMSYNITLSHSLNAYFDHSLGFTSARRLGSLADFMDLRTWRYDWSLDEWLFADLSGYFAWENGRERGGVFPERFDRFFAHIEANYGLGPRTELEAYATWTSKDSNRPLRSYDQVVVGLRLTYDF